jgi:hypothetical protein
VTHAADPDLPRLYHDTRERLIAPLSELDEAALATRVPACPAWSVHDDDVRAGHRRHH